MGGHPARALSRCGQRGSSSWGGDGEAGICWGGLGGWLKWRTVGAIGKELGVLEGEKAIGHCANCLNKGIYDVLK